jgi:hypothetical protein
MKDMSHVSTARITARRVGLLTRGPTLPASASLRAAILIRRSMQQPFTRAS